MAVKQVSANLLQKTQSKQSSFFKWLFLKVLILLLFSAETAFSGTTVKYLPGYDGELPFNLETGYISVNDSELFYYFIESQGNPQKDPLFLWLTGGPGCSAFNAIIYQLGPMQFDINNYTGGLPKLLDYSYPWTKSTSIIFLDSPVGTGFSYSTTQEGWASSDSIASAQTYEFLKKWLNENPKYLSVQLFVGGDSYAGIIVPLVTKLIINGNAAKLQPRMNLKGYLVGSPTTDQYINANAKIVFAHRMALISDELYEELKSSCNGDYVNIDTTNTRCVVALAYYTRCIKDLYKNDILEPKCVYASPNKEEDQGTRRSLQQNPEFILSPPKYTEYWCRNFNYALSYTWANDESVQDALHIRKGYVSDWKRCNKSLSYTQDVYSVVNVHRYLSTKGLEVLVLTGDRDMIVPFVGTVKWTKSLNLTIVNDWRSWTVDGQVAGYTRKYSEHGYRLTYATIKGGGHPATEYYRRECYEMFERWIHYYPL